MSAGPMVAASMPRHTNVARARSRSPRARSPRGPSLAALASAAQSSGPAAETLTMGDWLVDAELCHHVIFCNSLTQPDANGNDSVGRKSEFRYLIAEFTRSYGTASLHCFNLQTLHSTVSGQTTMQLRRPRLTPLTQMS